MQDDARHSIRSPELPTLAMDVYDTTADPYAGYDPTLDPYELEESFEFYDEGFGPDDELYFVDGEVPPDYDYEYEEVYVGPILDEEPLYSEDWLPLPPEAIPIESIPIEERPPEYGTELYIGGLQYPDPAEMRDSYCLLYPEECLEGQGLNGREAYNRTEAAEEMSRTLKDVDLTGVAIAALLLLVLLFGLHYGGDSGPEGGAQAPDGGGANNRPPDAKGDERKKYDAELKAAGIEDDERKKKLDAIMAESDPKKRKKMVEDLIRPYYDAQLKEAGWKDDAKRKEAVDKLLKMPVDQRAGKLEEYKKRYKGASAPAAEDAGAALSGGNQGNGGKRKTDNGGAEPPPADTRTPASSRAPSSADVSAAAAKLKEAGVKDDKDRNLAKQVAALPKDKQDEEVKRLKAKQDAEARQAAAAKQKEKDQKEQEGYETKLKEAGYSGEDAKKHAADLMKRPKEDRQRKLASLIKAKSSGETPAATTKKKEGPSEEDIKKKLAAAGYDEKGQNDGVKKVKSKSSPEDQQKELDKLVAAGPKAKGKTDVPVGAGGEKARDKKAGNSEDDKDKKAKDRIVDSLKRYGYNDEQAKKLAEDVMALPADQRSAKLAELKKAAPKDNGNTATPQPAPPNNSTPAQPSGTKKQDATPPAAPASASSAEAGKKEKDAIVSRLKRYGYDDAKANELADEVLKLPKDKRDAKMAELKKSAPKPPDGQQPGSQQPAANPGAPAGKNDTPVALTDDEIVKQLNDKGYTEPTLQQQRLKQIRSKGDPKAQKKELDRLLAKKPEDIKAENDQHKRAREKKEKEQKKDEPQAPPANQNAASAPSAEGSNGNTGNPAGNADTQTKLPDDATVKRRLTRLYKDPAVVDKMVKAIAAAPDDAAKLALYNELMDPKKKAENLKKYQAATGPAPGGSDSNASAPNNLAGETTSGKEPGGGGDVAGMSEADLHKALEKKGYTDPDARAEIIDKLRADNPNDAKAQKKQLDKEYMNRSKGTIDKLNKELGEKRRAKGKKSEGTADENDIPDDAELDRRLQKAGWDNEKARKRAIELIKGGKEPKDRLKTMRDHLKDGAAKPERQSKYAKDWDKAHPAGDATGVPAGGSIAAMSPDDKKRIEQSLKDKGYDPEAIPGLISELEKSNPKDRDKTLRRWLNDTPENVKKRSKSHAGRKNPDANDANEGPSERSGRGGRNRNGEGGSGGSSSSSSPPYWILALLLIPLFIALFRGDITMSSGRWPVALPTLPSVGTWVPRAPWASREVPVSTKGPRINRGLPDLTRKTTKKSVSSPRLVARDRPSAPGININNVNAQGRDIPVNINSGGGGLGADAVMEETVVTEVTEETSTGAVFEGVVAEETVIESHAGETIVEAETILEEQVVIETRGPSDPDRLFWMLLCAGLIAVPIVLDSMAGWPYREAIDTDYLSVPIHWMVLVAAAIVIYLKVDRTFHWSARYGRPLVYHTKNLVQGTDGLIWTMDDVLFGDSQSMLGLAIVVLVLAFMTMWSPFSAKVGKEPTDSAAQMAGAIAVFGAGILLLNA